MPLHTYHCEKCEKDEDRLVKFSDADAQTCACGEPLKIVPQYSGNFQLKGRFH
jgi:putative FmdB family regulatory protein